MLLPQIGFGLFLLLKRLPQIGLPQICFGIAIAINPWQLNLWQLFCGNYSVAKKRPKCFEHPGLLNINLRILIRN